MVISFREFNKKVRLGLFCPITSTIKGYPFEVEVSGQKITGCVLSDQVKSLDWSVRDIEYIEKLDDERLDDVIANILLLMRK